MDFEPMDKDLSHGPESAAEDVEGFPKRLKLVLEARGWSQNQLARRIGSTSAYMSRITRGLSKPGLDVLQRIAEELEVSLDWLVMGKGSMDGDPAFDRNWFEQLAKSVALLSVAARGDNEAKKLLCELLEKSGPSNWLSDDRQALLDAISRMTAFTGKMAEIYEKHPQKPANDDTLVKVIRQLKIEAEQEDRLSALLSSRF